MLAIEIPDIVFGVAIGAIVTGVVIVCFALWLAGQDNGR